MIDKVIVAPIEEYAEGYWKVTLRFEGREEEFKIPRESHVWVQTILKSLYDGLKS